MEKILYCYYAKDGHRGKEGVSEDGENRNVRVTILQEFVADYPVYYAGLYVPNEYENKNKSQKLTFLREAAGEIAKAMRHMMKQENSCFLVFQPYLEDWLRRQGALGWWKAMLGMREFTEIDKGPTAGTENGFARVTNVPILLARIPEWKTMKQVIVLGCPKGMIPLLPDLAEYADSMEVYVDVGLGPGENSWRNSGEADTWSKEPDLELLEQFEQVARTIRDEYGLCPQILPWKKKLLQSTEPALVMDFVREKNRGNGLAKGSLWVDMTGSASKEYFLGEEEGKYTYFSLKRIWWQEIQQTLDTIGKIKYNTQS